MRQSQWPLEVFLRDREWMQLSALSKNRSPNDTLHVVAGGL